jgi:hypothetical protein
VSDAFAITLLVIGAIGLFFILRTLRGFDPRAGEDDARAFFDEHGHWPDQTPEEAEAERRELARVYSVSQPDDSGRV